MPMPKEPILGIVDKPMIGVDDPPMALTPETTKASYLAGSSLFRVGNRGGRQPGCLLRLILLFVPPAEPILPSRPAQSYV